MNVHGTVLADSAVPPQVGASYDSRPEIITALQGRQVQVLRDSKTLGQAILASAVPIVHNRRFPPGRFVSPRASQRFTAPCAAPSSGWC